MGCGLLENKEIFHNLNFMMPRSGTLVTLQQLSLFDLVL